MTFLKEGIENLNFFLNHKFKRKFFFIFVLTLFASVVELIGIASLPLLVGIFFENSINPIISKLQMIFKIENPLLLISTIILLYFYSKIFFFQ